MENRQKIIYEFKSPKFKTETINSKIFQGNHSNKSYKTINDDFFTIEDKIYSQRIFTKNIIQDKTFLDNKILENLNSKKIHQINLQNSTAILIPEHNKNFLLKKIDLINQLNDSLESNINNNIHNNNDNFFNYTDMEKIISKTVYPKIRDTYPNNKPYPYFPNRLTTIAKMDNFKNMNNAEKIYHNLKVKEKKLENIIQPFLSKKNIKKIQNPKSFFNSTKNLKSKNNFLDLKLNYKENTNFNNSNNYNYSNLNRNNNIINKNQIKSIKNFKYEKSMPKISLKTINIEESDRQSIKNCKNNSENKFVFSNFFASSSEILNTSNKDENINFNSIDNEYTKKIIKTENPKMINTNNFFNEIIKEIPGNSENSIYNPNNENNSLENSENSNLKNFHVVLKDNSTSCDFNLEYNKEKNNDNKYLSNLNFYRRNFINNSDSKNNIIKKLNLKENVYNLKIDFKKEEAKEIKNKLVSQELKDEKYFDNVKFKYMLKNFKIFKEYIKQPETLVEDNNQINIKILKTLNNLTIKKELSNKKMFY